MGKRKTKYTYINHDSLKKYKINNALKGKSFKVASDPSGVLGVPYGRMAKKISWGAALFDVGINTFFNVKEGNSIFTSVLKGTIEAIPYAILPGPMITYDLMRLGGVLAKGAHQYNKALSQRYTNMLNPQPRFTYMDTRQALTMRQAAVQAIQGSKLNARNALGGEAALMHRTTRIY